MIILDVTTPKEARPAIRTGSGLFGHKAGAKERTLIATRMSSLKMMANINAGARLIAIPVPTPPHRLPMPMIPCPTPTTITVIRDTWARRLLQAWCSLLLVPSIALLVAVAIFLLPAMAVVISQCRAAAAHVSKWPVARLLQQRDPASPNPKVDRS